MPLPLITAAVHQQLLDALAQGLPATECSLDLGRSTTRVQVAAEGWSWEGRLYPFPDRCRDRTVYHWDGRAFEPVARFGTALVKLVPTDWGPPTFEIDGIKMLPTETVSPVEDAARKVALVAPRGQRVLDTCGGLGYFAACCLEAGAASVLSFEKNPDVLWLRTLNPWSPPAVPPLELVAGDVREHLAGLAAGSFDAILHDPPRFGIAGELYSQVFYDELARLLKPRGRMFHYTGTPNRLTSGRDVPREVAQRLKRAGFRTELRLDGVLAVKAR